MMRKVDGVELDFGSLGFNWYALIGDNKISITHVEYERIKKEFHSGNKDVALDEGHVVLTVDK